MFEERMGGTSRLRKLTAVGLLLACAAAWGAFPAAALAHTARDARTVRYHGLAVRVPRTWSVFDLARDPHACVRFDRHALYLGTPGREERCPGHSVGRTEAILISPLRASPGVPAASATGLHLEGDVTTFTDRSLGVEVTATWFREPGLIAAALGRKALPQSPHSALPAASRDVRGGAGADAAGASAEQPAESSTSASAFTGRGFDTCAAPSRSQMKAWSSSPYRAVGVYIGGVNEGCAQPNLSKAWISRELGSGWHLIPTYVGLQAPDNECGCAAISTRRSRANSEGRAAASDAVTRAERLGIGAGNPIYNDMEAYRTGGKDTAAVLAFLAGWTTELNAAGYISGVYSNAGAGAGDLVRKYGTGYPEPNDIWIADWNGRKTVEDPYIPRVDWPDHRRLHQYSGNVAQTYGRVTISVDQDYVKGATVGKSRDPHPQGYLLLTSDGGVHPFGHARPHGSDQGKLPLGVTAVALAEDRKTGGYWILKSNGGVNRFHAPWDGSLTGRLGGLRAVALGPSPQGGYLILTSNGGVHAFDARWHGSDVGKLAPGVTAVGIAVDPKTGGYRILKSNGGVSSFDAPWDGSLKHKLGHSRAVALAPARAGGYFILTSNGAVHPFGRARFYGSDAGKLPPGLRAVSLATCPTTPGYRILRSDGGVNAFGEKWYGGLEGTLPVGVHAVTIAATR